MIFLRFIVVALVRIPLIIAVELLMLMRFRMTGLRVMLWLDRVYSWGIRTFLPAPAIWLV